MVQSYNQSLNQMPLPTVSQKAKSSDFFTSHVIEEIGGRPLPGVPIKIMGYNPRTVGQQVAKLVRGRYRDLQTDTVESMPRARMITIHLKSSYLLISLDFPCEGPDTKKLSVVFSRFVKAFTHELRTKDSLQLINHRRRKTQFWSQ